MVLVLDVGNTNIVIGVYNGVELLGDWRLSTDFKRTSDEYGSQITHLFILSGGNRIMEASSILSLLKENYQIQFDKIETMLQHKFLVSKPKINQVRSDTSFEKAR